MRIAFLVHKFPSLSETFILTQITDLLDAGHEVDIFASGSNPGETVQEDVQRYRLLERTYLRDIPRRYLRRVVTAVSHVASNGGTLSPGVLVRALNVCTYGRHALSLGLLYETFMFHGRRPYDIIHCQFATLASTAVALRDIGAAPGSRLVVSFRGFDLPTRGTLQGYRRLLEEVDLLLPVCEGFKTQLIEHGCDPRRIRVHHSGVKLSRFGFSERGRAGNEPTRVLTIARLVEKKGVAYAIRAIARVKQSGRPLRLLVIGDGPLRGDLERLIDELQLREDVHMLGPRPHDEVIALLKESHLLAAPSVTARSGDQEGIPNVLKEGMATGIPVIATWHSGIPELVEDGVSGLLVAERDVEGLAGALTYLIDHPERWTAMGRAGRARVEAQFDSDKLNQRLMTLYENAGRDGHPLPVDQHDREAKPKAWRTDPGREHRYPAPRRDS